MVRRYSPARYDVMIGKAIEGQHMHVLKVYRYGKLILVMREPDISAAHIVEARKKYKRPLNFVAATIEAGSIYELDAEAYANREELGLPHP